MKSLRKDFLLRTNNVDYTKAEKDILTKVNHPFIVALHYAFQNEQKVYMIMDFINGGQVSYNFAVMTLTSLLLVCQILFHLREQAMFSEKLVQFYAAEVTLALEHLHNMNIIHRDLKVTYSLFNLLDAYA